jgi:hypothetical protein
MLVLTLADVYEVRGRRSPQISLLQVGLALTTGFATNCLLGLINPAWTLPFWIMVTGIIVSTPLLYMLRSAGIRRDDAVVSGGGVASLNELRRRSTKEYETAHRVKWAWLVSVVVGLFTTSEIRREYGSWVFGVVASLIAIMCLKLWLRRSDAEDPYRRQLERKQDHLLFWAGSTLYGLLPGVVPALILLLIAYPLFGVLARWLQHFPANIHPAQVAIAFGACALLLIMWLAVRDTSLRAARAIREELDEMDRSEDDKQ